MLEEAVPAIWASVNSWFTPTVLFVLLNVVIGTIAVTSKGIHRNPSGHDSDADQHHPAARLARSPSLVLERLRSFKLYSQQHFQPTTVVETVPLPEPPALKPEVDPPAETRLEGPQVPDLVPCEDGGEEHQHHFGRTRSDSKPTAGEMPGKLARKMKKSASTKSAFAHFEEVEIVRRPATTKGAAPVRAPAEEEEEEEVDARADDFINKFRQQLKLQRLDSIIRYKEMLNRGK